MNKKIPPKKGRKNRILVVLVAAFLGVAIIFGSAFAIALGVRNNRAVVACDGVTMDEGVTRFFLSYYKSSFLSALKRSGIDAYDTEEFWSREYYSGTTYGDYYKTSAKRYITELCASAYLFDELTSLSGEDKENIKTVLREVLDYKADGSRARFDEQVAEYGFDYSDFEKAAKLLYKAQRVRPYVFGEDGEKLVSLSGVYSDYIDEYYANYSRVKLLFIRTEDTFLLDADGNRLPDADGNDTLVPLSEEQKAERRATIDRIRAAIAAIDTGADGAMNAIMFDTLLKEKGEGDADKNTSGYYFFAEAEYTAAFSEKFSDIVKKSYSMKEESYGEVATDFGVCFIYKCPRELGAYTDTDKDGCFSDFYSDAADYIFARSVTDSLSKIKLNEERLGAIDLLSIPANSSFVPKF